MQEAICPSAERRAAYPRAVMSIKSEMTIPVYCKRIASPTFWGGESELLVLSSMLRLPITVYLPAGSAGGGMGFVPLVTYGEEFAKTKAGKERPPVRLLYSDGNQCAPRLLRVPAALHARALSRALCVTDCVCASFGALRRQL